MISARLALAILVVATTSSAQAQTLVGRSDSIYTWRGAIPARAVFTIRNFNGPVDVRAASGTNAELRAEKRTQRRGAIEDIAFDVETMSSGDVTICAVQRSNNPCDDRHRDRGWNNDDDDGWRSGSVAMTVMIPRGVQVRIATGNGAISVENVNGDVTASTGNGRVHVSGTDGNVRVSSGNGDVDVRNTKQPVKVSTGNGRVTVVTAEGPVEVHTGSGSIDVTMTSLRAKDDMTFSSGNGEVRVTLPNGYNGELEANTGNGGIESEFELKVQGRLSPNRVRATIGAGGPRLRLSTGNGRLELRRAN